MSNKKKGIVAGALAALLIGGAGTFALWADDAPVTGNTITIGSMSVDGSGLDWTRERAGVANVTGAAALTNVAPGDVLTGTWSGNIATTVDAYFEVDLDDSVGSLGNGITVRSITSTVGGTTVGSAPVRVTSDQPVAITYVIDVTSTATAGGSVTVQGGEVTLRAVGY